MSIILYLLLGAAIVAALLRRICPGCGGFLVRIQKHREFKWHDPDLPILYPAIATTVSKRCSCCKRIYTKTTLTMASEKEIVEHIHKRMREASALAHSN